MISYSLLSFFFENAANTSCIENDIFPFNDQTQNATKRKKITRYAIYTFVGENLNASFFFFFQPSKDIYCNNRRPHSNFQANELDLLRYDLAGTRPYNMKILLL